MPDQQPIDFSQVQGNILQPYQKANCARLLFFRFDHRELAEARKWVRDLAPKVSFHGSEGASNKEHRFVRAADGRPLEGDGPWINVGFTCRGLSALGFDPFTMTYLPEDFRDGMRERADRLGDDVRRVEHEDLGNPDDRLHAVVLVYAYSEEAVPKSSAVAEDAFAWNYLEEAAIEALEQAVATTLDAAVAELPTSPAVSHLKERDQDQYVLRRGEDDLEFFGFPDGISQPRIVDVPDPFVNDTATTEKADIALLGFPRSGQPASTRGELALEHLRHGSFLVIRKLAQDVDSFRSAMNEMAPAKMTGKQLAEQMMGRRQDGTPLIEAGAKGRNDFNYDDDPDGSKCPFQSHIRRANPRDYKSPIRRMMRRSMPYSSYLRDRDQKGKPEQGLLFQAYNANLELQFEFVQRLWVNSGTETRGLSSDRDPVVGEHLRSDDLAKDSGSFSFTSPVDQTPKTLTGLSSHVSYRGGGYFLVPSRRNLQEIGHEPSSAITEYHTRVEAHSQARARDVLGRWLDDTETAKRIWQEVRDQGGVVRLDQQDENTVLVGTTDFMETVLQDDGSRYSVSRQGRGMRTTTGPFYLGMDPIDPQYQEESRANYTIIPGWKSDPPADPTLTPAQVAAKAFVAGDDAANRAEVDEIRKAAHALCLGYLGVSVTEAVANHGAPGTPKYGTFNILQYVSYVLSGMVPRLFGVPQPSIAGTFRLNIPSSGSVFFPFPEATFLEYAEQASKGISAYLAGLFDEGQRRREGTLYPPKADGIDGPGTPRSESERVAWEERLDDTLEALESVYQNRESGVPWSREDSIRTMAGIISGMLVASFKLFIDGASIFTKEFPIGEVLQVDPALVEFLPFEKLAGEGLSMPNILYRRSCHDHELNGIQIREDDFVLTSQGSAMGELTNDRWFYGDRTPTKTPSVLAPHFCPGFRAADAMLGKMSEVLFGGASGLVHLRRLDEEGLELQYDWEPAYHLIENVKKMSAASKG